MNRYELTTEVHHDAENTAFAKKLKALELTKQEYVDWLYVQYEVHLCIDPYLIPAAKRVPELYLDLNELWETKPRPLESLRALLSPFWANPMGMYTGSLCYVLTGAHLRGGPQNRKSLEAAGLPCRHLRFERDDAAKASEYLKHLRELPQFSNTDIEVFRNVKNCMQEIVPE